MIYPKHSKTSTSLSKQSPRRVLHRQHQRTPKPISTSPQSCLKEPQQQKQSISRLEASLRAVTTFNNKLQEELRLANEQLTYNKQYINKIQSKLVQKASQIEQKLIQDLEEAQRRLLSKDRQIRELNDKLMYLTDVQKDNQILRSFIDKAGKNTSKQLLILENSKIDMEKKVLELELELAKQQPSQELIRSQYDVGELKFYLGQKDEYCSKLLKQNCLLRERSGQPQETNLKKDILGIIGKSFPQLLIQ